MKHFHGNIPAVIDTETTSLDFRKGEIIEICIMPLDPITLDIKSNIFHIMMKPNKLNEIDYDALAVQKKQREKEGDDLGEKVCSDRSFVADCVLNGTDQDFGNQLLIEWFENLKLGPYKKLLPIAHNWGFDSNFIREWLGWKTYDYIFHYHHRDTREMATYDNDAASWQCSPLPFDRYSLRSVAHKLDVTQEGAHNALDDCVTTAKVFKAFLKRRIFS